MKVLIWIGCFLGLSVIVTLIRSAGILLGGIPTFLLYTGMFWVARKLCELWDNRKDWYNET